MNNKHEGTPKKLFEIPQDMDGYTSIIDKWLKDDVNRASQFNVGWTEGQVKQMDQLAREDHLPSRDG